MFLGNSARLGIDAQKDRYCCVLYQPKQRKVIASRCFSTRVIESINAWVKSYAIKKLYCSMTLPMDQVENYHLVSDNVLQVREVVSELSFYKKEYFPGLSGNLCYDFSRQDKEGFYDCYACARESVKSKKFFVNHLKKALLCHLEPEQLVMQRVAFLSSGFDKFESTLILYVSRELRYVLSQGGVIKSCGSFVCESMNELSNYLRQLVESFYQSIDKVLVLYADELRFKLIRSAVDRPVDYVNFSVNSEGNKNIGEFIIAFCLVSADEKN